jgi:hypothetical protein
MEPLTKEQLAEKADIEAKKAAEKQAQLDAMNVANGGQPTPPVDPKKVAVKAPVVPPEAA